MQRLLWVPTDCPEGCAIRGLVDHAAQLGQGEAMMGNPQRMNDIEQLEILGLLEAVNTDPSAMRAARALAELMRHVNALGERIAVELPDHHIARSLNRD
jgi:hypothetical protein